MVNADLRDLGREAGQCKDRNPGYGETL